MTICDPTLALCLSDTPGPPADKILISRVTEEKCTVSWKIPLEDGGDIVSHYIVERRETSRLNWVVMETECKTLSCVSSRLIKNNEYIFRVRGVNKFGPGVPLESDPVIARNAYSKFSCWWRYRRVLFNVFNNQSSRFTDYCKLLHYYI